LALPGDPFAAAHFDDFLNRDDDLAEVIIKSFDFDAALDAVFDGLLAAALHLDDIPALIAGLRSAVLVRLRPRRGLILRLSRRAAFRRLRFGSRQIISHA